MVLQTGRHHEQYPPEEPCVREVQNLGAPHYYDTKTGRALLLNPLAAADLVSLTDADQMVPIQAYQV